MSTRELSQLAKVFAYACLIGFVFVISIFIYLFDDVCQNAKIVEKQSPDGARKIILFERDCGATTGFSSQISILPSNKEMNNEEGNVYIATGEPKGYQLEWKTNTSVEIMEGFPSEIFKRKTTYKDIAIKYR